MDKNPHLSYPEKEPEDRVLAAKPRASLRRVASFGSLRLDGWQNMLIFGDNLIALRLLCNSAEIRGKVRLVYIDPPFSTNQVYRGGGDRTATVSRSDSDRRAYEDLLVGGKYLEFLRKRLILLKALLSSDGSIYVHIGSKMGHYVKVLMDEVFGQDRFVNDIARVKCNPKNFERRAYGNVKDMVLFYSKTDRYVWNDPREEVTEEDVKRLFPKVDANGRRYTTTPLHAPGETKNGPTGGVWRGISPPKGRHWRCSPDELERLEASGLIEWSSTGNPRKKVYADQISAKGKKRQDVWEFKDPPYPRYPTEKNLEMLKMIVQTSSNPGDLVLDCFAGSGTTLVAAEETGRRWVGIDNSGVAIEVAKGRMASIGNHSAFALYEVAEADA